MIPSDLKDFLSHPQTPWKISPELTLRLEPKTNRFKAALLQPSDPEAALVLRYFMANKPPGYSIGQITCIHNRSLHAGFTAHLTHTEEEAKKFPPSWDTETLPQERSRAVESWRTLTQPFSPITVTIEQEAEVLKSTKILPLWHGTTFEKAQSICESGFTYFGKHAYFTGRGSGSTDIGYFGSGIYFTDSAQYATLYSQRFLLLSWVSMREPYPVVNDRPLPYKGSDMNTLEGKGAYKNYDTHFVPVVSIMPHEPYCMNYFPCFQNQKPAWHEIVVFQKAQALPCFIIELSEDLIHPPSTSYSFTHCYAACQAGEFSQIEAWINEDRKHLQEENELGENLLFAAVLGNQLTLLKWLYAQEPSALKKCRKDGWTLMHAAIASGHTSIVKWLHPLDPLMIKSGKVTPLHIAAFSEQTAVLELFLEEVKQDSSLIEEILKRPCPVTLKFLLENGLDSNQTNRFKQTLLHLAAQSGHVDHIELLLEKGVQLNAQDLSKKTPLYLAVTQGHLAATVCLLEKGADPTITGIEGDTILHCAAFYGYTPIVAMLLHLERSQTGYVGHAKAPELGGRPVPISKTVSPRKLLHGPHTQFVIARGMKCSLLHCADKDGKQPIHKAVWGHPKPDVVELLLTAGADPNASNKFGYTPLHWAAKHGHIASAELLLRAGGVPEIANQNHDLPLDLAIRWGQDDFVRFFLGLKPKGAEQLPQDIEGYYCTQLLQAKRDELYQEQIFYLEKLSDLYVQKKNWAQAAKILNGAFAILEKNGDHPHHGRYLLARLERIEALFLESKGLKVPYQHQGTVLNYRSCLENIRTLYFKEFEEKKPIQGILPFLTVSYKKLLRTLILDSQALLGPPPVEWACVGMGSMARSEMCPYSDLEFAFLIGKKTEKNLTYFRTLAELLELRIINLGETAFPIFGKLFEEITQASPTPSGFSMDSGGNTPLGKPGFYELINTPEGLAQFQSMDWMEIDIIVINALSTVCYIAGNEKLARIYHEAKEAQWNATDGWTRFTGTPFRKKLAMKLLEGNLREFKPDLSKKKEDINAFCIKKELYRPLQSILGCITLFCGLQPQSSFGMIKQLLQNKFISLEGAKNLNKALQQVLTLRFEAHVFYQNEGEFLLHIEEEKPNEHNYLYLNEKRLSPLREIYQVLFPLHCCAEEFLSTQDPKIFEKTPFYNDSPLTQGVRFTFGLTPQYGNAQEAYQQAVSLNPNDIDAQLLLGNMEMQMGKSKEALPRELKALVLAQQKYGENHLAVATGYNNVGVVYKNLGDYEKAIYCYQKALDISRLVLGENHRLLAKSYLNLGSVYYSLKDYNKAIDFYGDALILLAPAWQDKNSPETTRYFVTIELSVLYNNLGMALMGLESPEKALESYQLALEIWPVLPLKNHPQVAITYNNIAAAYCSLGEFKKELEFFQKALEIQRQVLGENHPNVASSYNSIGLVYYKLGEHDKALDCHQKSLKILLQVHRENHPHIESVLISLIACIAEASFSQVAKLHDIHTLCVKLLGKQHILALQLAQLINSKISSDNQALQPVKFQQAYRQAVSLNPNTIHTQLESVGTEQKMEFNEALSTKLKALALAQQKYGENHPDVAIGYNNIGHIYLNLGKYDKAIECYQKALKIWLRVNKNHPDLATSYHNIGLAHAHLGKYDEAIDFYQKALEIVIPVLGEKHSDARICYDNLSSAYRCLKDSNKELEFRKKALKIRLSVLGENHPELALGYNNVGILYYNLRNIDKGLEFCNKALLIFLRAYGNNRTSIDTVLKDLIVIVRSAPLYQLKKSLDIYTLFNKNLLDKHTLIQELIQLATSRICSIQDSLSQNLTALELAQQKYGETDYEVGACYHKIGTIYFLNGEYLKALDSYQKSLPILLLVLGDNHPDVAASYSNISDVYKRLREHDKFLGFLQKALHIWLEACSENHPYINDALQTLITYAKKASPSQIKTLQEVCALCKKSLGEQHVLTLKLTKIVAY